MKEKDMGCEAMVQSWSFTGLVGAFLDLLIAYLLLCCSTIAFFLSKFLALLGLTLPCPCNGFFGYPQPHAPCLHRLLVDYPFHTLSSLHLSLKTKFPFHSHTDHCQFYLKLLKHDTSSASDAVLEFEGLASYTSFSDPRTSHHTLSLSSTSTHSFAKPKGAARSALRRRRRATVDYSNFPSVSSYDHASSDALCFSSASTTLENSTPLKISGTSVQESESNDAAVGSKLVRKTSLENLRNSADHERRVNGEDENLIRILELALEEEQAARAELCSELEQERLAAATAADEAMAMISRLQEEKASIEIEAHQYQRILEEKSVYDAEEMDILKEIIVRRERERLILEKEVEAYRKVFQENNGPLESQSNNIQGQHGVSFLDPTVDPMLILQQLSESIDKRGNTEELSNYPDYSSVYVQKQSSTVSEGKESSIIPLDHEAKIIHELESSQCSITIPNHLLSNEEANQDIQEKGILSSDEMPYPQLCQSSFSQGLNNSGYCQQKTIHGVLNSDDGKEVTQQVGEPCVHDVHIIDSKGSFCKYSNEKEGDSLLRYNDASNAVRNCEWPSDFQKIDGSAENKFELDINESSSDIVDRFPKACSSSDRSFVSELRRNSISAGDHERLKIDNEIVWLRAKLTAVQEQKEKLKSSLEHPERGKSELQLLEDITAQLREIRQLNAPEKAARQGSLPPLSSKVTSKKRRSRSASLGVGQSESS